MAREGKWSSIGFDGGGKKTRGNEPSRREKAIKIIHVFLSGLVFSAAQINLCYIIIGTMYMYI